MIQNISFFFLNNILTASPPFFSAYYRCISPAVYSLSFPFFAAYLSKINEERPNVKFLIELPKSELPVSPKSISYLLQTYLKFSSSAGSPARKNLVTLKEKESSILRLFLLRRNTSSGGYYSLMRS